MEGVGGEEVECVGHGVVALGTRRMFPGDAELWRIVR